MRCTHMDTRKVIVRLPEKLITHADVASEVMQKTVLSFSSRRFESI